MKTKEENLKSIINSQLTSIGKELSASEMAEINGGAAFGLAVCCNINVVDPTKPIKPVDPPVLPPVKPVDPPVIAKPVY